MIGEKGYVDVPVDNSLDLFDEIEIYKLLLKGSGDVKEDLLKMIEIWKKENP